MATAEREYRLAESPELKNGQKVTVKVEGIEDASVLLMKVNNHLRATGTKCTRMSSWSLNMFSRNRMLTAD
jgi:hypothetical protein